MIASINSTIHQKSSVESIYFHVSIGCAHTAALLYLFQMFLAPWVVDEVYHGRSLAIFSFIISGQQAHASTEYLSALRDLTFTGVFLLLVMGGVLYLLSREGKYQTTKLQARYQAAALFFVLTSLIVLRDPQLFSEPRFWAEEATVFYQTAYFVPTWEAFLAPHQGYLSLWANIAGILANIPPIEYAPSITTGMALIVILTIISAIIVSESEALNSILKKAIAGIAVLVVGATGEIWLTSINSQYYFVLLSFLILIDKKHNPTKIKASYIVAAVSGSSSVMANFLTPLYLLRYFHRREKADLFLFFIFASTAVVQLTAIAYSLFVLGDAAYFHPGSQARFSSSVDMMSVAQTVTYYALKYPFFGDSGQWGWFAAAVFLMIAYTARSEIVDYWEFFASLFLVTTLSVVASLGMTGGSRYAYPASVVVVLQLLRYSRDTQVPTIAKLSAGILLAASIGYWSAHFVSNLDDYRDPLWPKWSDEVRAWRLEPGRKLQAHPIRANQTAQGLIWAMELPPQGSQTSPHNEASSPANP